MSLPNHRRSAALSRSLICALTALAVATASCSSMHKVPTVQTSPGQPIAWQVKAGDTIRVMMRDGGSSEFRVQSVTPEAIISSDGTRFEQANITSMERRGFSSGKTAGAAVGGLGVIALVVVVVGALTFLSWLGGGARPL